jgi:hypothetical protein
MVRAIFAICDKDGKIDQSMIFSTFLEAYDMRDYLKNLNNEKFRRGIVYLSLWSSKKQWLKIKKDIDDEDIDDDGDGIPTIEEDLNQDGDPTDDDTDEDGYNDGKEVAAGTDPLNDQDFPVNVVNESGTQLFFAIIIGFI